MSNKVGCRQVIKIQSTHTLTVFLVGNPIELEYSCMTNLLYIQHTTIKSLNQLFLASFQIYKCSFFLQPTIYKFKLSHCTGTNEQNHCALCKIELLASKTACNKKSSFVLSILETRGNILPSRLNSLRAFTGMQQYVTDGSQMSLYGN